MVRYLFYTLGDLTYQSPLVSFLNGHWQITRRLNSLLAATHLILKKKCETI